MEENVATLEFEFYPHAEGYEDVDLRFSVPTALDLRQFHGCCKRFALAMGFRESSIDEVFGEDIWD